jgi:hypothetical protein
MSHRVQHRNWKIAFVATAERRFLTDPECEALAQDQKKPSWLTVEAVLAISGMRPHGLLVARFIPGDTAIVDVDACETGRFSLAGPSSSGLLGVALYPGLPRELADGAIAGAKAMPDLTALGGGVLTFAGGGLDSDSSPSVFERLGQLSVVALAARGLGVDESAAIQGAISEW